MRRNRVIDSRMDSRRGRNSRDRMDSRDSRRTGTRVSGYMRDSRYSEDYARGYRDGRDFAYKDMDSRRGDRSDYTGDYDYYDGYDYDYEDGEKKYYKDLEEWEHKLKTKDRFKLPKEQVLKKAEEMGVKFHEFSEEEFYVVYLMVMSDYPKVANEPHTYLAMAKAWLEDDDIKVSPSEKLCAYLYYIVKGEMK